MKKQLLYSLLATSFFVAKAQAQSYYWVYGQKVPVTIDSSRFTIESQETLSREAVRRSLGEASLKSEIRNGNQSNRFLVNVKDFAKASGRRSLRVRALPSSNVHYALKLRNGDVVTPTGDIVFQPKQGVSYEQVAKRLKGGITLLKSTPYNTFLVHPTNPSQLLALANKIYESGLVEWAQPDFYSSFRPFQNDPLYPNQYYLNNTGQTGGASDIDINAPEAWCLTKGSSSIRVAVIDAGVEAHNDLAPLVPGFDPHYPNSPGVPRGTENGHGESSAGIIAALHNNVATAGVAPNVQLVPVNIFDEGDYAYPDSEIAAGINWAWDPTHGNADVLSNSWGGGSASAPISAAIRNAISQGRGGKGCIVVFSAGNDQSSVSYPATDPNVIAVGAIDKSGNLSYYSNTGPQIALVAPTSGNTADVVTLDRAGSNGYNSSDINQNFGGTSAACPQVAGVAALMLSVNPALTFTQAYVILVNSATAMGGSVKNDSYGYGRLNALKAINNTLTISGVDCLSGSSTYSLIGNITSTGIVWSSSDTNVATVNSASGLASAVGNGTAILTATISTSCGSTVTVTKRIFVGAPPVPTFTYSNSLSMCYGQAPTGNFKVTNPQPGATYGCQFINNATGSVDLVKGGSLFYFNSAELSPGTFTLNMTATNACGSTSYNRIKMTIRDCGGGGMYVTAYPNPASEAIQVPAGATNAVLLNGQGKEVQRAGHNGKLDVNNLPAGIYNLQSRQDGKLVNQRIEITH